MKHKPHDWRWLEMWHWRCKACGLDRWICRWRPWKPSCQG